MQDNNNKKDYNSAIEKAERIANENSEREREIKADEKKEGEEQKRLIRQKKIEEREKRKDERIKNGLVAGVVTLGVITLMLASVLAYTLLNPSDRYDSSSTTDEKSFYELVSYVDGLDVNLSKLTVSKDDEKRQKLLGDVRVQSSLATESLSALSLKDEDKYYTVKFINQVNDFSKYLIEKLIDGETLTQSDIKTLESMRDINKQLKENLGQLTSEMGDDYDFKNLLGNDNDVVISKFKDLETLATEYPHMIYDGAFSDGTENQTAKALENLEEISKMQAQENFETYFSGYGVKNVEVIGETTGRAIETYNLEGVDDDGVTISAQISKKGGKLVEFNYFKDCNGDNLDLATAEEVAAQFLEKIGYKDLKAVWTANSGNVITINFASVVNGVICYPDLIKVNVCRERKIVSGIEASSYIYNNCKRSVKTASVTLSDAKQKVSGEIDVENSRLAIIPKGSNGEVLAYEFYGQNGGEYYYIYIDAETGRELDVFKVIKGSEGDLLA